MEGGEAIEPEFAGCGGSILQRGEPAERTLTPRHPTTRKKNPPNKKADRDRKRGCERAGQNTIPVNAEPQPR